MFTVFKKLNPTHLFIFQSDRAEASKIIAIFPHGYNITTSQLGDLFYNQLGGVAGTSITTRHNTNYNLFSNVQGSYYWSSSEYAPSASYAWQFATAIGSQDHSTKDGMIFALAVHPGDVTAVPLPGAVWLFLSGLLVVVLKGL